VRCVKYCLSEQNRHHEAQQTENIRSPIQINTKSFRWQPFLQVACSLTESPWASPSFTHLGQEASLTGLYRLFDLGSFCEQSLQAIDVLSISLWPVAYLLLTRRSSPITIKFSRNQVLGRTITEYRTSNQPIALFHQHQRHH
jgi:hypothetical protein